MNIMLIAFFHYRFMEKGYNCSPVSSKCLNRYLNKND